MGSSREGMFAGSEPARVGRGFSPSGRAEARPTLFPDSEFVDDRPVALLVRLLQIVEKTATASDQLEQSAPAVVVLRMRLEMLRQIADAIRQKCDLHLRRAGVVVVGAILRNQICFLLLG